MTVEERKELQKRTEEAIKNGGFYNSKGIWNSIITFPGDNRLYRHRVETIVVRNNKEVFMKVKPNGDYRLPGGSTERDIPNIQQAENEVKEEAHISINNIESTGITYKEISNMPKWASEDSSMIRWDGYYTEVYIAEYDKMFHGHIDKEDEDPFIRSGRFYPTKEAMKLFRKEHREALLWYLQQKNEDKTVTESYITNYFGNKRLLKKISNNPEVDRSAVDKMINEIDKAYRKLMSTSKIKREMKQKDVGEIFHPVMTFDFSDGSTIGIVLCFDKSSFTDGAAIHTEEYGDLVIIYPCFFDNDKEGKIFTLLHEIGHIRLGHLKSNNIKRNILGEDISHKHRSRVMGKGKAVYPEVNADFYAILNGASMYAILGSSISADYDSQYDYRFTNSELANRYSQVWDKYKKIKKGHLIDESETLSYNAAYMAIYEMSKEACSSIKDRKDLQNFMYEYYINKKIKDKDGEKEMLFSESRKIIDQNQNPIIHFSNEKEIIKKEIYTEMMKIKNTLEFNKLFTENVNEINEKYIRLINKLKKEK